MSAHPSSSSVDLRLELDFGDVGGRQDRGRFAVWLDASRLHDLMTAAFQGLRVYEMATLRRPGDLWPYVDVRDVTLPAHFQGTWNEACRFQPKGSERLPLDRFDGFFHWLGDDTEPVDEAWRSRWDAGPTRRFIADLFQRVQRTLDAMEGGDLLMQHELRRIREGRHAYDAWPMSTVRSQTAWVMRPEAGSHSESFYGVLDGMLRRPEVEAVAYRGDGDYRVMRSMCVEQRRRADDLACAPEQALRMSALTNRRIDNIAWDSALRFYEEGIGWGDLFIDGDGDLGAPLSELLGTHWQRFGRWVLSARDLGPLKGYAAERGDGWVLYEALPGTPIPRPSRKHW